MERTGCDSRTWYRRPLGVLLEAAERAELERVLDSLFGYHLLQVGQFGGDGPLAANRIPHHIVLNPGCAQNRGGATLYGDPTCLPIVSDSLDVIVLLHTLESEDDPHQVLREVDRTLIPEGHLVVLGFNPVSLWGLSRMLRASKDPVPWCPRFFSQAQVKAWLSLLGFEMIESYSFFYKPAFRRHILMRRAQFLERIGSRLWPFMGGVYLLLAKKRVIAVTPIRPQWHHQRDLIPGGLAEPAPRNASR
jgi:Methylase involved in ubiquinone/menaquinone biosynthesis